jgi:uncharacterized protein YecE (DUF72 family)
MADLWIGTSAFSAKGWVGNFYPKGTRPREFLAYYASQFKTVELDTTYYGIPAPSMVEGWKQRTPPGFLFSAKMPQVITHEKLLVDCDAELGEFLGAMSVLGEKLGPLLLQFGYFNKSAFRSQKEFVARLEPFLKKLPREFRYAVEIRNKEWVDRRFLDLLRQSNAAFALTDQSRMPRPWELPPDLDLITADFSYIRLLGDRKAIEAQTQTWSRVIVDRDEELRQWVKLVETIRRRVRHVFLYANNHYQGYSPATAEKVLEFLNDDDAPRPPAKGPEQFRLF